MNQETENWNRVRIPKRVMDRAVAKTALSASGCWISGYSVASHGYAQIGWQVSGERHMVLAHRAVWERFHGPVPVGMTLDHVCKVKRCVNPGHLRVLTNFENARRTLGREWDRGECPNGHPNALLGDTFRTDKRGNPRKGKRCAECRKVYARRHNWRVRHPGAPYPSDLLLRSEVAAVA